MQKYFGALESLRGIAALVVVVFHASWAYPFRDSGLVQHGYIMVDFFFVLSGFVICHAYGERIGTGEQFAKFAWARFWRLYPLHFAMLAVWVGIEILKYAASSGGFQAKMPAFGRNDAAGLVENLFLVQAFSAPTFNDPSWSISAEVFAYLLFACLTLGVNPRYRAVTFAAMSAIGLGSLLYLGEPDLAGNDKVGLLRCMFGFFLGAFAYLVTRRVTIHRHAGYWIAAIIVAILLIKESRTRLDFVMPFLFCLLVVAVAIAPLAGLTKAPIRWLGRVSYSIYMVHFACAWIFHRVLIRVFGYSDASEVLDTSPIAGATALLLYIASVLAISHFTFRLVEHPFKERAKAMRAVFAER